jgi:uncharacterized protein (DUF488 family)
MKIIYTLGTSLRSLEDFIEILKSCEIKSVIDVRSYPSSKIDHFKRPHLEASLKNEGLLYYFLGKELGGLRRGGYEHYMHTEDFTHGINLLEDIASKRTSVIICAERFPWRCHRRFIAQVLQNRGWTVKHILEKDKLWIPKQENLFTD